MFQDARSKDAHGGALPAWHIFLLFLRLGLTSFGGPTAHLGFFHQEFVNRRRWLSDSAYGEVVAQAVWQMGRNLCPGSARRRECRCCRTVAGGPL